MEKFAAWVRTQQCHRVGEMGRAELEREGEELCRLLESRRAHLRARQRLLRRLQRAALSAQQPNGEAPRQRGRRRAPTPLEAAERRLSLSKMGQQRLGRAALGSSLPLDLIETVALLVSGEVRTCWRLLLLLLSPVACRQA